jgi:regulator of protease activity HflC (stomatin/prohibitin superfamily)
MTFLFLLLLLVILLLPAGLFVVRQGTVAVITTFGRYTRVSHPGLAFRIPIIQSIHSRISVQNRSMELTFQAITQDQANVYFKAMLLFAVQNDREETIKSVAFKFIDVESLMVALVRTVEAVTRGFVATKKQAEILGLRAEIVSEAKAHLDETLAEWGYHLIDLQLNDITFDATIATSMAQVVASQNLQRAAEFEGQALYIKRTKEAEAEGAAIKIAAEAEALAAQRRGEGVRMFRFEVARGLADAARTVSAAGSDESLVLFAMWTEALRDTVREGKGNVVFLDGSLDGMQSTLRRLSGLQQLNNDKNLRSGYGPTREHASTGSTYSEEESGGPIIAQWPAPEIQDEDGDDGEYKNPHLG